MVTCVTQGVGVYCRYKSNPHYAKLWVSIPLSDLTIGAYIHPAHHREHCSVGIAFLFVLMVALNLRVHMPNIKPITKLFAVKTVVGLGFLQKASQVSTRAIVWGKC